MIIAAWNAAGHPLELLQMSQSYRKSETCRLDNLLHFDHLRWRKVLTVYLDEQEQDYYCYFPYSHRVEDNTVAVLMLMVERKPELATPSSHSMMDYRSSLSYASELYDFETKSSIGISMKEITITKL